MAGMEGMLRCGSDLVTARALIQAVRAINPDVVVLEEGTRGGRCELTPLGELGSGANGCVERCRLKLSGDNFEQLVAVKRFHSSQRPNVQQVNHFLREASLLGCLAHPNIIRLLGIGTVDGTLQRLYTALELAPGPSLLSVVERQLVAPGVKAYSMRDALRWCTQLADALMYIHTQHRLVHRDVKLRNLALTADDPATADVKLLDWGLACKEVTVAEDHSTAHSSHPAPSPLSSGTRPLTPAELDRRSRPRRAISSDAVMRPVSSSIMPHSLHRLPGTGKAPVQKANTFTSRADVRNTASGTPLISHLEESMCMNTGSTGTPIYSSPEARLSTVVDHKSDMYSFGMVVYELFNYTTVLYQAALASHTSGTGAVAMVNGSWVPQFQPHCPQAIVSLVKDCWAREPGQRPSAAEALKRLRAMEANGERPLLHVRHGVGNGGEPDGVCKSEMTGTGRVKRRKGGAKGISGLLGVFPCMCACAKEEC